MNFRINRLYKMIIIIYFIKNYLNMDKYFNKAKSIII